MPRQGHGGPEPTRHALIVRLSAIGDIVHTLPVAAALSGAGWRVSWLVEPPGESLLRGNPAVARSLLAPSPRALRPGAVRRAVAALRAERIDVAFDVQGLWKSALWTRLAGATRRIGLAARSRREPASALLLDTTVHPPARAVHVVDQNLTLLTAIGIEADGRREFPLPSLEPAERLVAAEIAALGVGPFALLHPGGGWESKLWPIERWAGLACALAGRGLAALVSWGPGEAELARAVVERSGGAAVLCFPTTLLELAALGRAAVAVVAADSGPLHLAAAAGARVVGLYGPTDPARNGPYSPDALVLRRVPSCAPCHRRRCLRHSGSVGRIPVEEVVTAIERQRSSSGPARVG